MRKERVGALKAFRGLRKCAPGSPLMKSDEGHGGTRGALWKAEKKSYIHAEFTVQDELKFLIREGARAQFGLTVCVLTRS